MNFGFHVTELVKEGEKSEIIHKCYSHSMFLFLNRIRFFWDIGSFLIGFFVIFFTCWGHLGITLPLHGTFSQFAYFTFPWQIEYNPLAPNVLRIIHRLLKTKIPQYFGNFSVHSLLHLYLSFPILLCELRKPTLITQIKWQHELQRVERRILQNSCLSECKAYLLILFHKFNWVSDSTMKWQIESFV
jgi:hypothetical protein